MEKNEIVGLLNNDNTCYMNTIIQCLYHINYLTIHLLNNINIYSKTPVLSEYINILMGFEESRRNIFTNRDGKKNYYISKSGIKYAIAKKNTQYNNHKMNDSAEFLGNFLSIIENEINEILNKQNIINHLFNIELETITICEGCKKKNKDYKESEYEKCYYINLPVLSKKTKDYLNTLEDCIKEYQGNLYFNEYCDRCEQITTHYENIKIKNSPNLLIFNLKRVVKGEHYSHSINFQDNLNLNNSYYSLKGIIIHYGTQYLGHKIALCKDKFNKWNYFDDEETKENIYPFCKVVFKNMFMLFYEKNN